MAKISFNTGDRPFVFQQKMLLKTFIESIFKKEKKQLAGLRYVFCSDDMLLDINRNFLQHDYFTDIITFGLSEKGQPIEGEIYISIDRVEENAAKFAVSKEEELNRVLIHGFLHLMGYKDKSKVERENMRMKEDEYLELFKCST